MHLVWQRPGEPQWWCGAGQGHNRKDSLLVEGGCVSLVWHSRLWVHQAQDFLWVGDQPTCVSQASLSKVSSSDWFPAEGMWADVMLCPPHLPAGSRGVPRRLWGVGLSRAAICRKPGFLNKSRKARSSTALSPREGDVYSSQLILNTLEGCWVLDRKTVFPRWLWGVCHWRGLILMTKLWEKIRKVLVFFQFKY